MGIKLGVDLVAFDWSGPISEDKRCVYEANMNIFRRYGVEAMPYEQWLSELPQSQASFMKSHGINLEADELFRLYTDYYNDLVKSEIPPPCLHPDVRETLEYLQGMGKKLAVVSSHPEGNLRQEAKAYGLEGFFGMVIGSTGVASSGGKAQGLRMVCDKLKVSPGRTLFVGDMSHDILAGREAGTCTAGISGPKGGPPWRQRGYQTVEELKREGPDLLLESLMELKEAVS
jgi:pyrophosphatase PpaX